MAAVNLDLGLGQKKIRSCKHGSAESQSGFEAPTRGLEGEELQKIVNQGSHQDQTESFDPSGSKHHRPLNMEEKCTVHREETLYMCSVCGQGFNRSSGLSRHKRSHTRERPYKCGDCGKGFNYPVDLQNHQRTHTGVDTFYLPCVWEGIHSDSWPVDSPAHSQQGEAVHLLRMWKRIYSVIGPADTATHSHRGEAFHLLRVSEGIHRFLCPAETPASSHRQEFKCPECGKNFKTRCTLREHQYIHTGSTAFSCSHCQKGFRTSFHLVAHECIHTGERPFPCSECGKGFNRSSNLQKHQ
ncbi:uncharacterized protein LOC144480796 [Mustelus asterias]